MAELVRAEAMVFLLGREEIASTAAAPAASCRERIRLVSRWSELLTNFRLIEWII